MTMKLTAAMTTCSATLTRVSLTLLFLMSVTSATNSDDDWYSDYVAKAPAETVPCVYNSGSKVTSRDIVKVHLPGKFNALLPAFGISATPMRQRPKGWYLGHIGTVYVNGNARV